MGAGNLDVTTLRIGLSGGGIGIMNVTGGTLVANLTLPLSSWTALSTNTFKEDGTFDYTNAVVPLATGSVLRHTGRAIRRGPIQNRFDFPPPSTGRL
jgi:hypothetical protein